jgi:hypothetical protein
LINQIQQAAAKIAPQDQAEQLRVLVGSFIEIALHETAHAIYDIFQVPIWGREEDGADRLAALIMVEFGEDMERTAISLALSSCSNIPPRPERPGPAPISPTPARPTPSAITTISASARPPIP